MMSNNLVRLQKAQEVCVSKYVLIEEDFIKYNQQKPITLTSSNYINALDEIIDFINKLLKDYNHCLYKDCIIQTASSVFKH